MSFLEVEDLTIEFGKKNNPFRAVDRVSFKLEQGQKLGILGESGSGKSVTSLAILGLIDFPGRVTAAKLRFRDTDLQSMKPKQRREVAVVKSR